VGSVEADDERQIAVADYWQLQRLVNSSLTDTAAPYPGDIGGPSEQACTRPAPGRPASAAQYAVDVTVLDLLPDASDNPCSSVQNTLKFVNDALQTWFNVPYDGIVISGMMCSASHLIGAKDRSTRSRPTGMIKLRPLLNWNTPYHTIVR